MGPRKLRENESGDEVLDSEEQYNGPGNLGLSPEVQEIDKGVKDELRAEGIELEVVEDGE